MATESSQKPTSLYDWIDTQAGNHTLYSGLDEYGYFYRVIKRPNGSTIKMREQPTDGFRFNSNQAPSESDNREDQSKPGATPMSTQDKYIDARLAGIESSLDARMSAMQRFQEQAEQRFQRSTERHETDIALTRQQIHEEFRDARKHSTNTAWATVGGVFAVMAVIVALGGYWISEQGSYAKSYGENQVEIQRAADERSEFREAVKSIQATQESILERLPASTDTQ